MDRQDDAVEKKKTISKKKKDIDSTDTTSKKKTVRKTVKKEEKPEEVINNKEEVREVVIERKVGFNYAEVIVIMIITLILGGVIGSFISYITTDNKVINNIVEDVPEELEEFVSVYNNILNEYYEDIDEDELLEAGINGMLEFLGDDYSVYMDQEITQDFNEQVEGKYTGIGVEITQQEDKSVMITRVFSDSPAEKAGLKVGDIFYMVGDVDVTGISPSEISSMIKSSNKNKVELVMLRDSKEKTFTLTLEEVEIESVTSKVFEVNNKKIGYIGLSVFASNTYTQFEKELLELEKDGIDSLVIDVRDNSGGYLSTVTSIASLFLEKDKVVYQLDTKGVVEKIYSSTSTSRDYDIAVLINYNSASASEILAAAIQESYGGVVVGVNSYGKGTVQKAYQLESGATVKYTIQKWLTPDGNWINEKGVTPDIEVELNGNYYENPTDENDNQLQKALEELSK